MRRNINFKNASFLSISVLFFCCYAHAGTWTFLNNLDQNGVEARDISGDTIVGKSGTDGFIYNGSNIDNLRAPGAIETQAWGVSGGKIAGFYYTTPYLYQGFIYDGSEWNTINAPDARTTSIFGISGSNIVGTCTYSSSPDRGFLYDGQTWTFFNKPGANYTAAYDIDGSNIVGHYNDGLGDHGYLYDGSSWTTLDAPGAFSTYAFGISGGYIAGYFMGYNEGDVHGFIYDGSSWTILDAPGSNNNTYVWGIDGSNVIGHYYDDSGNLCNFIYTVLEPATPPIADAGSNQVAYAWIDGIAEVTLDGSASYDPDGDELTYLWQWSVDGNDYEANGVSPTIELPVGQHTIELVVNDGTEDSEPNYVEVNVVEPIEGILRIAPQIIHRRCAQRRIMTTLWLQDGITRDQIDNNSLLLLYPGEVETERQCIMGGRRVCIFAFFDRDKILEAIGGTGPVEVYVVGQLKTGQYFFGSDEIIVICPGNRPWHHRPWWKYRCGTGKIQ
jgi:hypothetical protein